MSGALNQGMANNPFYCDFRRRKGMANNIPFTATLGEGKVWPTINGDNPR
jgi:hypothetical protein